MIRVAKQIRESNWQTLVEMLLIVNKNLITNNVV